MATRLISPLTEPGSPYSPSARDRALLRSPSPWSAPSPSGSGYDSLTLPPINPDANYDHDLPSFDNSQYFDALPRLSSPSLWMPALSELSNSDQEPPPSNQQARRPPRIASQYEIRGSESPDPFDDFFDPPSPIRSPAAMPSRTRSSSVVDLTATSPPDNNMVSSKKRKAEDVGEGRATKATKRPTSSRSATSSRKQSLGDVEVVDLEDVDSAKEYEEFEAKQQAEAIRQQNEEEANKPVKLAEFQCIICMDNPTDLTVTHCGMFYLQSIRRFIADCLGHLFCSECLHSALYAGDKKNCPVCRTAISTGKPGQKPPKNGIFVLEMKLMTANKKGKQPVRVASSIFKK